MALISREEWQAKVPPFTYIKVTGKDWNITHRDIIGKWIGAHCGGWCYHDGDKLYVFERPGDRLMFRMWVTGDPFAGDEGEILPP